METVGTEFGGKEDEMAHWGMIFKAGVQAYSSRQSRVSGGESFNRFKMKLTLSYAQREFSHDFYIDELMYVIH